MLHIWKAYLTLQIVKQDKYPKHHGSYKLLSSKMLYPTHLIYTCLIFPCQHFAVVSCLALCSPLFFFSSPGHRPCELLPWVSVRRPSVSFSHLNLLFWNHWTELNQTCQKYSLDDPLLDLCFWCWFEIQHGCQGP